MRDPHGLLQAILDDPADDLPRLAYADWLEETGTGPAWAFHVRRMVRNPAEDRVTCAGLTVRVGLAAEPELILTCPVASGYAVWRRGFIAEVCTTLAGWGRHGPELVRRHPIEKVGLTARRSCRLATRPPGGNSPQYGWWRTYRDVGDDRNPLSDCDLPKDVWDLINLPRLAERWKYAAAEDAAEDALSAALLAWAKGRDVANA